MLRNPMYVLVAIAITLSVTGCETTQEISARKAKELGNVKIDDSNVSIGHRPRDAKILSKTLIRGESGSAVVVEVKNTGSKTLYGLPVAVRVKESGKSVYSNRQTGLNDVLLRIPSLAAGKSAYWVNNQLPVTKASAKLKVALGSPQKSKVGAPLPASLSGLKEETTAGKTSVSGTVRAKGRKRPKAAAIFVVYFKGQRPVAAGSSEISSFSESPKANFTAPVTGSASGAKRTVIASVGDKTK